MIRKVCVVTGTRAEFGLLRWLMNDLAATEAIELQIIATGTHLSPEFGMTISEVESTGFTVNEKIEMLLSADTGTAIAKSTGLGMIGFSDAYARLRPDLVVVLGDRFEIFAAAATAMLMGLPVAHLNGGEATEGAFDEALRHSITKMSHLHFVAAEEYRHRVIQLGEVPEHVFTVGGTGVDAIRRIALLGRPELESAIDFRFGGHNLLVTFHPVTLQSGAGERQFAELLAALEQFPEINLVFTQSNADPGGRRLAEMLEKFLANRSNARCYSSLGQLRYLSCLQFVDAVVGNSSSGLAEAPSFHIGTINIGDRQKGRLKSTSVIDCQPDRQSIAVALQRLYDPEFQSALGDAVNPYGDGGASARIAEIIRSFPLEGIIQKAFHNLPMPPGG